MQNPLLLIRELNNRSFFEFFKFFWPEVSSEPLILNWHIEYLCGELQTIAERVGNNKPRVEDLIINIPPGTTKTILCSIMFPAWCWTRWYHMKFICVSYTAQLALESAEYSRDLVRSDRFSAVYPELGIKEDKDTKSNFRVIKRVSTTPGKTQAILHGGNRFSTSVGGSLTGFHGHIIIWDDPLNPQQAVSETELHNINRWMSQTLPTRKVNKVVSTTIGVMQRLHQNDPSGYILGKKKNVKHICLPGEINNPKYAELVNPPELKSKYVDGLLDANRLNEVVLKDLEADLGQYAYAGQIGQSPTPPAGGMFKVDNFAFMERLIGSAFIETTVRFWDKAGTKEQVDGKGKACYTVGVKMSKLSNGKYLVQDVIRGRWSSEERERKILQTAEADGVEVNVYYEQEPGSGGKESAEATTKNLAGFHGQAILPKGDKIYRADPYSVQVNLGQVILLKGDWNHEYIEEHRHFPFSTYKDQVDASSGAFSRLASKRMVKTYGNGTNKRN
jgi:predicted phage terminase large subunit-like protein